MVNLRSKTTKDEPNDDAASEEMCTDESTATTSKEEKRHTNIDQNIVGKCTHKVFFMSGN